MKSLFNKYTNSKIREILIAVSILLFIGRMALPGLKYPFIGLFILSVLSCIPVFIRLSLKTILKLFLSTWQFIILGIFLITSLFVSIDFILDPVFEIMSFMIIMVILVQITFTVDKLKGFLAKLQELVIYISISIALIGLTVFIINFEKKPFGGSSIVSDNNFYALYSILGVLLLVTGKKEIRKRINGLLYYLSLLILYFNIIFSYSRRGFIVLGGFLVYLSVIFIIRFLSGKKLGKVKDMFAFYISAVAFSTLLFVFIFATNGEFKKSFSEKLSLNYNNIKLFTSSLSYRYLSIIDTKTTYPCFVSKYYNLAFNKKDPSTWNIFNVKIVENIEGKGDSILPNGTKAIKLDKTITSSGSYTNARKHLRIIEDSTFTLGSLIRAKIYCYVSEDYDGKSARLLLSGSIDGHVYYDMARKGEWQLLSRNSFSKKGPAKLYAAITKDDVRDFTTMNGYVLFANPSLEQIKFNKYNPRTWGRNDTKIIYPIENQNIIPDKAMALRLDSNASSSSSENLARTNTRIYHDSIKRDNTVELSVYCYVSEDFGGDKARLFCRGAGYNSTYYDMSRKGTWQKLKIKVRSDGGLISGYLYVSLKNAKNFKNMKGYVLFAYPEYNIINESVSNKLAKPEYLDMSFNLFGKAKSLVSNLVSSYQNKHDSIHADEDIIDQLLENRFTGERIARWQYAYKLYREYPTFNKIFGSGFTYMNQFGEKFYKKENKTDYPHNPIISAVLYSGLLGGLFYIYFLFTSLYYYLKYLRHHWIFFILYLLTFFFVFFSGNTHFDVPVFSLLSLVPFMTRYFLINSNQLIDNE